MLEETKIKQLESLDTDHLQEKRSRSASSRSQFRYSRYPIKCKREGPSRQRQHQKSSRADSHTKDQLSISVLDSKAAQSSFIHWTIARSSWLRQLLRGQKELPCIIIILRNYQLGARTLVPDTCHSYQMTTCSIHWQAQQMPKASSEDCRQADQCQLPFCRPSSQW